MQDLKEAAIRGTLWSGIDKWGQQALTFIIFAVLARLLGPDSFGLVALAGDYVAFLELFVKQGFGTAIIQRLELEQAHLDAAFLISLLISAALSGGTLLLAHSVALAFGEPKLGALLCWLSLSLPLGALSSVPIAILTRDMRFRSLATSSLVATSVGGAAGITLALSGFGVWSLVGQQLVGAIVAIPYLWWVTGWLPHWSWSRRHFHDLFGFSWSLLASSVLWFFCQRSDQAIVGRFLGTFTLGQYAIASRLVQLLRDSFAAPLSTVALPAFCAIQNHPERLMRSYYRLTEYSALVGFPLFVGLIALVPEGLPLLLGTKWAPAVPVAQLLAVTGLLHMAFLGTHPLTMARGRPAWCLVLNVLHAAGTILAAAIGLRWGIGGVATGLAISWATIAALGLLMLRRLAGIEILRFGRCLVFPAFASLIMYWAVFAARCALFGQVPAIIALLGSIVIGIVVYGLLALGIRPTAAADLICALVARKTTTPAQSYLA